MIFPIFTRYFPYIHREYTPYPLDFSPFPAAPAAPDSNFPRIARCGSLRHQGAGLGAEAPWRPGPGTWGPNGNDVKNKPY